MFSTLFQALVTTAILSLAGFVIGLATNKGDGRSVIDNLTGRGAVNAIDLAGLSFSPMYGVLVGGIVIVLLITTFVSRNTRKLPQ